MFLNANNQLKFNDLTAYVNEQDSETKTGTERESPCHYRGTDVCTAV